MTGRGVDQILAHPSDPTLYQTFMFKLIKDSRKYVEFARNKTGEFPPKKITSKPSYIWGYTLKECERMFPNAKLINVETAITLS